MTKGLVWSARLAAVAASLLAGTAYASISYDAGRRLFRMDGGDVTYAMGIDAEGTLTAVYWGKRLAATDDLRLRQEKELSSVDPVHSISSEEYPGWGGAIYTEPTLKLAWKDGVRDVVLHYKSHRIDGDSLTIELADIKRPITVTLRYTIDPDTGIVGRSSRVANVGREPVRLDQASSAAWSLPTGTDYRLHYLTGRWAAEFSLQNRMVTPGSTVLESRRGATGHQNNPWFAIDRAGLTTEENGPVWFGALAWSGSWRISVDRAGTDTVRVVGGYNPFDFAYPLKGGQTLETPVFYGGYTNHGMGEASRLLHRFERADILPQRPDPKPRPVLYNSWEATGFDVDEAGQIALAQKAARIGVERFVMDDGWFGARNSDKAGLGDWTVNPKKFPRGLKPLIDAVHGLGMSFGLWVEPEMVNPDSDLYRKHPDWVIAFPTRPRTEARNQLVLNLARPEVRDFVLKAVDDLVTKYDIQFLKWDYNRNFSEPGWLGADVADQQKIYVEYVRNLYAILAELRRRHPNLEIETCSGGGGRVDLGILGYTDEAWPSDNTDPYDRLTIQDGYTHAYSPGTMMAWVTDSPNWVNNRSTTLDYRFLSSMQGGLGVGANLNTWTDQDFAYAAGAIADYKKIRATVQAGDLYRLIRPGAGSPLVSNLYVAADKRQAALFTFLHSSTERDRLPRVKLEGLDPARRYRMGAIGATKPVAEEVQSGAYWMSYGVDVDMVGDFQAMGRVFEVVD